MSEQFIIERRIEIDAAHRVPDHKSKCFALHGHRYVILAGVCSPLQSTGEQRGMVMDFGFLKEVMMQVIHEPCDHGTILYDQDKDVLSMLNVPPYQAPIDGYLYQEGFRKIYLIDGVPTAENLARHWHHRLTVGIREFFKQRAVSDEFVPTLAYVKVFETPNCWAQYPFLPQHASQTLQLSTHDISESAGGTD